MDRYPIETKIIQEQGQRSALIHAPEDTDAIEAWRKIHHDYLAAMRSLRYLAQKALQNAQDTPEQALLKKNSLARHLQELDRFEQAVVLPILHDLPRSPGDEKF